jgi:hypothetical protein
LAEMPNESGRRIDGDDQQRRANRHMHR